MKAISYKGSVEENVQVTGRNLPISRKIGREIAVFIKGKNANRAISELKRASSGELAIPYKRFNRDTPHRKGKGMMSGRYPVKASLEIVKLIESLKANAENKALDSDSIKIVHASCQHGTLAWHYGRKRRRRRKLAHFELVGVEIEEDEEKKYVKKADKKRVALTKSEAPKKPKVEAKKEVKVEDRKEEKKEEKKEEPKKAEPKKEVKKAEKKPAHKKVAPKEGVEKALKKKPAKKETKK